MCRQEGRHVSPGGLSGWMAQRSGAGRVPDRRQQMWLGKHPLQSRSESARVGGINEQSVFFVFDQLWRGPVVGGDDGQAAVHRFQADDAKPFAWRCQHHQVGAAIGGAQRRTAQLTRDLDATGEPQCRDLTFDGAHIPRPRTSARSVKCGAASALGAC